MITMVSFFVFQKQSIKNLELTRYILLILLFPYRIHIVANVKIKCILSDYYLQIL